MDLGPHAATIALCYAAVTIAIGSLIAWLVVDGHDLAKQLADLEARGIRRRSARPPEAAADPAARN